MTRKLGRIMALCCLVALAGAAWGADAPAFQLTPEAAALLKERGSVGFFYWGAYRDC